MSIDIKMYYIVYTIVYNHRIALFMSIDINEVNKFVNDCKDKVFIKKYLIGKD